jgi:ssDNA-binding Zn-finger/Zn-ribbon topoisomerase 1
MPLTFIPALKNRLVGLSWFRRITGPAERGREAGSLVFAEQAAREASRRFCWYFTCVVCQLEWQGHPQRRVCWSPLCQWLDAERRRAAQRRTPRAAPCKTCGRVSPLRRTTKHYCTPACKQKAYRARRRVLMQR